jgi:RimJ/RimL family protein N-acetyltransferase
MLQGDVGLEAAALEAVAVSRRPVQGFIGTWVLVSRARTALGFAERPARHDGREALFSLPLEGLREPPLLAREDVALRVPTPAEATGVLSEWRVAYEVETLGSKRNADVERAARETMQGWLARGTVWVLSCGTEIVSMTGFNAVARGVVQVGGVYTPPALRARSYGRAAVAASLKLARDQGATRSVLFTSETNLAAQRAYMALGYQVTGDFGLVLF